MLGPLRGGGKKMPEVTRIVKSLLQWYGQAARDLPWRRSGDPYGVWVSEVMLQQTQVATVIPYWERWMATLPDIRALAEAPEERVLKHWEGLGYYSRARNLQRAAQQIQVEWGGAFPDDYEAILSLPGIGRYTAGAVASIAFGQAKPILDGNVIRVLTRLDGLRECVKDQAVKERLWQRADALVQRVNRSRSESKNPCGDFNQSLMELGALVCVPRNPACDACPLRTLCLARRDGLQDVLPNKGERKKMVARHFLALVMRREGEFLVRQRQKETVNRGFWEFPATELSAKDPTGQRWILEMSGRRLEELRTLGTIKHAIMNNRITLNVMATEVPGDFRSQLEEGRWVSREALEALAFTSAHRKIVRRLLADSVSE